MNGNMKWITSDYNIYFLFIYLFYPFIFIFCHGYLLNDVSMFYHFYKIQRKLDFKLKPIKFLIYKETQEYEYTTVDCILTGFVASEHFINEVNGKFQQAFRRRK
ncbi:hypothetical protein Avbf_06972 [Armadillidium vulgare]|nr:hypothetical protein Avbf_06972 [Armadillidium vulgare]